MLENILTKIKKKKIKKKKIPIYSFTYCFPFVEGSCLNYLKSIKNVNRDFNERRLTERPNTNLLRRAELTQENV